MGKTRGCMLMMALALACGGEADRTAPTLDDPGKADGLESAHEFRCHVVEVRDVNVLEEGLGSIYDIDTDGFLMTDGDSFDVSLRKSDLSEHESGLLVSIGQMTVGLHSADDLIEEVEEAAEFDDFPAFKSYRVKRASSSTAFKIRLFTETKLALIFHENAADGEECREDALTQCEGSCGESTETIDEEFACAAECPAEAERECKPKQLAVADCRDIELPPGLLDF
ncbi:MAG: hypothetical protein KJO07_11430 [Deltaproteobacteria bacterium]|nr:hypothetical protein [Deltaproteobacteria bacterium]